MDKEFFIVDVFAERPYSGNQLAVFTRAGDIPGEEMQKLAREINFSETTFILGKREEGYEVRIFTPQEEVPFAGHPTLGTAYIIAKELEKRPLPKVVLKLQAGTIPVEISYEGEEIGELWMQQISPTFQAEEESQSYCALLGLAREEVDGRYPAQGVSTGLPFTIIPLPHLQALQRIQLNPQLYREFIQKGGPKSILAFAPETYGKDNDVCVRVFADYYGVPEDAATGSANGCLAAYLARHDYFGKTQLDLRVEQGYEMNRPSLLKLKTRQAESLEIYVGGSVIPLARGTFF